MGKPKKHGQKWTSSAEAKLRRMAKQDASTKKIAGELGRTTDAIYKKASEEKISLMPHDKKRKRK